MLACVLVLMVAGGAVAQCPWAPQQQPDLTSACVCAQNSLQELSVQCDAVAWPRLLRELGRLAAPLDLLYVSNSSIPTLPDNALRALPAIKSLQLSGCGLRSVAPGAFHGHETVLRNLNLQDNDLGAVPVEALSPLTALTLLDLSRNRVAHVPSTAFATLSSLTTLRLADNANMTLAPGALAGLGASLRNLNMRGARFRTLPHDALRGLRNLVFLDLSHNSVRELPGGGVLASLDALAAVNLERNLIQTVAPDAFVGVDDTLSSLSMLNNLLTDFPSGAVASLRELRVLDLGFNLMTEIPSDAFQRTPGLTLLALDGNPLRTVPEQALVPLKGSLRGLSLGGRALKCDCRIRWLVRWLRSENSLQLTSRERDPQFCGSPARLRDRTFSNIRPDELTCGEDNELDDLGSKGEGDEVALTESPPSRPTVPTTKATTTTTTSTTTSTTTTTPPSPPPPPPSTTASTTTTSTTTTTQRPPSRPRPSPRPAAPTTPPPLGRGKIVVSRTTTLPPWRNANVLGHSPTSSPALVLATEPPVVIKSASRQDDSSVVISWDSRATDIPGFRVVYRLFGDKSFKQGPPLELSEREFKIKNVPPQECIVVCVVSLGDVNVTPETVLFSQCREVRTSVGGALPGNMDKITIAASAVICVTVVLVLVVFLAASKRRSKQLQTLQGAHASSTILNGGKPGLLGPGICCPSMTPSPATAGPLSSLTTTIGPFTTAASANHAHKDWDQGSVYSGRSIPRPRSYHLERQGSINAGCTTDDMHSHASHFSNNSTRYLGHAFASGLVSSRPELRQSRQSLAAASDRMSHASMAHHHHQQQPSVASSRRQRPRSRDRGSGVVSTRPGSRYSSTHTLNKYCGDSSDNWRDHDVDFYMARNPTTRGGVGPV